jgi:hypothetical protein
MDFQKDVIPAQAGIQVDPNLLKILDSRFHGNDGIGVFLAFYKSILKIEPTSIRN